MTPHLPSASSSRFVGASPVWPGARASASTAAAAAAWISRFGSFAILRRRGNALTEPRPNRRSALTAARRVYCELASRATVSAAMASSAEAVPGAMRPSAKAAESPSVTDTSVAWVSRNTSIRAWKSRPRALRENCAKASARSRFASDGPDEGATWSRTRSPRRLGPCSEQPRRAPMRQLGPGLATIGRLASESIRISHSSESVQVLSPPHLDRVRRREKWLRIGHPDRRT